MERIKKQIDNMFEFNGCLLSDITTKEQQYIGLIRTKVDKMKKSTLFTDEEVAEIEKYALDTLDKIVSTCRKNIIENARAHYTF